MALQLKYKDEHGILHINMSPTGTPKEPDPPDPPDKDIKDPKFDSINNRFGQYDLFGGKYDSGGDTPQSLFRSRYNSIEEELANTPYAFATERSLRLNNANLLDITISSRSDEASPSKDIEDDRFFRNVDDSLFGPQIESNETPAFTVTQLIHAQDRYFDLSSRQSSVASPGKVKGLRNSFEVRSEPGSARERTVRIASIKDEAFKVLCSSETTVKAKEPLAQAAPSTTTPVVSTPKRKRESSFAIIAETTVSRPSSPRSLPVDIRTERVSPFRGRGFRQSNTRHNTPRTSAANSRANSPPRRRTNSLPRIDKMAQTAALPPPILNLSSRPHSLRNFLKENIEEVRELSELNREKHEAEAEKKRQEEEEALLKEMGLTEKNAKSDAIRSVVCSRTTSRSSSPNKVSLRSRSNSPSAILHFESIPTGSQEFINKDDGMPKPVTHKSRLRSVSRSQPQSNDGSPKHSKIPKRQSSVSPARNNWKDRSRQSPENNLNKNQRFISNSTSSIHETIKIGSQVHDKRAMSKSTQFLNIAPAHIRGKPPISPGRNGPPPANKSINAKRLSPIVGTPNKSPVEDLKPKSAKPLNKPSSVTRKPVKTAGNTPATSRLNSRQPSRPVSRDHSPEKRKTNAKSSTTKPITKSPTKPVTKAPSTKTAQRTPVSPTKPEPKKPMNRTTSMKSLTRTPSTRTLNEKPPMLQKRDSKRDLSAKASSTSKINEVGAKKESAKQDDRKTLKSGVNKEKISPKKADTKKKDNKTSAKKNTESNVGGEEVVKKDNETQYDKMTNEKGELVILTKKSVVSMTTAAIASQPLEVVTTVTNQLPAAFEKAREKGIFERLSSRDSLAPKEEKEGEDTKTDVKEVSDDKDKATEKEKTKEKDKMKDKDKETDKEKDIEKEKEHEKDKTDDKKQTKQLKSAAALFLEDNVKLKPLQPPFNNPHLERVRHKIDEILKEPEVSTENILASAAKTTKETKNTFRSIADKTKTDIKSANEAKDEAAAKLTNLKDQAMKQNDKMASDMRTEAAKIVDSIITPIEEPKELKDKIKEEVKKDVEPIVVVVNEKKKDIMGDVERMTETLVKGEPEVEVQSSNVSTPGMEKMDKKATKKMMDGSDSDKSTHSNGGFPQSTSTTPKPPIRNNRRQSKEDKTSNESKDPTSDVEKQPNICVRLMQKCKTKCCPCCVKGESDEETETQDVEAQKKGTLSKLNCFKRKEENVETEAEMAAGKASTIEFESETKRKRKLRDILCGCCGHRRVSDVSDVQPRNIGDVAAVPGVVNTGCFGKRRPEVERRDSILSDRPPPGCWTSMLTCCRGSCRRHSEQSSSRRTSMFSKNKSLSPTLPPEDTRKKLDTSLVEHTSMMRGAIPALPPVLAYFCLLANILIPGLGTIFSGMFCLCFGVPRFGVHDGAKHRIGSFLINLVVGCGQLFTVLFCLVGWGWSIWWGVILVRVARKYRKLKAEEAAEEAEAAPPITDNNHTRA